jgi:hypothetical protein
MPKTLESDPGSVGLSAADEAIVKELAELIQRLKSRSSTPLVRLASRAFEMALGPKATRRDKFDLAVARGWETRQQLAEAEGGSLSSDEAARMLGISKTAVLKRLESGRLLAWREERLKAARFPRWQFDERGQVLAGLEDVLECLGQDAHLDAWGRILFFLQTKPGLGGQRPLDYLRGGKVNEVCRAAEAYAG